MNGYRFTRSDSVPATQARIRRCAEAVERAYADVTPKPETLRNVRYRRTLPIHERHFRELDKQVRQGAALTEVLAGGMGTLMDLKRRHAAPAHIGVDGAHDAEFQTEAQANPIQLKARMTRSAADLRDAIEWTDKELATLMDLRCEFVALLEQKELLDAQVRVGRQPVGA